MKQIIYDNYTFNKDQKTGYYLSTKKINGKRKRLHVYIWEKYNGEIPKGAQVHHIDGDKASVDINNLELLTAAEHMRKHWQEKTPEEINKYRERIKENCISKAAEWHGSEEGRQWHKEQAKRIDANIELKEFRCEYCGTTFKTKPYGKVKYCSNKCKAAARRKSGVDNEERICIVCGAVFITNKYKKAQICSQACANKKRGRL